MRLCRGTLIEALFPLVAVDDPFLPVCPEIFVPRVALSQDLIGVFPLISIHNAPIPCVGGFLIHGLKIKVYSTRLVVVFKYIICSCILKELCKETLSPYSIPGASVNLSAQYHRALHLLLCNFLFKCIVLLRYIIENPVGLCLFVDEQGYELYPLRLPKRVRFLVAKMWNQRNTSLLEAVIAAPLERGEINKVWIYVHYNFIVKIPLNANASGNPLLNLFPYCCIVQEPGT